MYTGNGCLHSPNSAGKRPVRTVISGILEEAALSAFGGIREIKVSLKRRRLFEQEPCSFLQSSPLLSGRFCCARRREVSSRLALWMPAFLSALIWRREELSSLRSRVRHRAGNRYGAGAERKEIPTRNVENSFTRFKSFSSGQPLSAVNESALLSFLFLASRAATVFRAIPGNTVWRCVVVHTGQHANGYAAMVRSRHWRDALRPKLPSGAMIRLERNSDRNL